MKRALVLAMLLLSVSAGLFAIEDHNDRFAVSADPLMAFFGYVHASFQFTVSNVFAIPVFYIGMFPLNDYDDSTKMHSLSVGARFYPAKKVYSGFYIGPLVNFSRTDYVGSTMQSLFGFGMEAGWMINVGDPFFIDLGAGVIRYVAKSYYYSSRFFPVINMSFGYRWGARARNAGDPAGKANAPEL